MDHQGYGPGEEGEMRIFEDNIIRYILFAAGAAGFLKGAFVPKTWKNYVNNVLMKYPLNSPEKIFY